METLEKAKLLFDEASDKGFDLSLLDIGGGFPGSKDCTVFDEVSYFDLFLKLSLGRNEEAVSTEILHFLKSENINVDYKRIGLNHPIGFECLSAQYSCSSVQVTCLSGLRIKTILSECFASDVMTGGRSVPNLAARYEPVARIFYLSCPEKLQKVPLVFIISRFVKRSWGSLCREEMFQK